MILKTFHSYKDIPYTRYERDDHTKKSLLFFFHGFTSNKDEGIMGRGEALAELGYLVIALDAYAHGARIDEAIIGGSASDKYRHLIDIIIHTARDAKDLFMNHLVTTFNITNDTYYAFGVSMGAATALYLGSIDTKLKTIISIVGSPSLYALYLYKQSLFGWENTPSFKEKLAYYQSIDPLIHYETLKDKHIFLGCGKFDEVVPPKFAKALSDTLNQEKTVFKLYEVGHSSTEEMLQDAYNFLVKY
jgi:uncharacterized protein